MAGLAIVSGRIQAVTDGRQPFPPSSLHLRIPAGRLFDHDHVRLSGTPAETHYNVVNGRTLLERFIDRYRITTVQRICIANDSVGWFGDRRDVMTAILRFITLRIIDVSVATMRIARALSSARTSTAPDPSPNAASPRKQAFVRTRSGGIGAWRTLEDTGDTGCKLDSRPSGLTRLC